MATELRLEVGDDDEMALADFDETVTSRAEVLLARRIRLHRGDDLYPERAAHSTSTTATRMVPATMAMSTAFLRCWRKGLKPMAAS